LLQFFSCYGYNIDYTMKKKLIQKFSDLKCFTIILVFFHVLTLSLGWLFYRRQVSSFQTFLLRNLQVEVDRAELITWIENEKVKKKWEIVEGVSSEDLESTVVYLSQTVGIRIAGSNKEREAADWLEQEFESFGYETEQQTFTLTNGRQSKNVIAYKDAEFVEGEKTIIIGAHYDSTETSPGAHDDGSGVASLLEIARVLSGVGTDCNLVFILFGAEECIDISCSAYHQGSIYYVSQLDQTQRESIYVMINLDVIGMGAELQIRRAISLSEEIAFEVETAFQEVELYPDIVQSKNWGDHESFEAAGIPAIFIFTPGFNYGHSPQDTIDKVDFDRVEEITKGVMWYLLNKECEV